MKSNKIIIIDYVLFTDDLTTVFKQLGYRVVHLRHNEISVDRFKQQCKKIKPAFVFTINFSPEIALLCSLSRCKYVSWTIDPLPPKRFKLYPKTKIDNCILFAHQHDLVNQFRSVGFKQVSFLPLAAPENRRKPITDEEQLEPYRCTSSFVGQSQIEEYVSAIEFLIQCGAQSETLKQVEQWMVSQFPLFDQHSFTGFTRLNELPDWLPTLLPALPGEAELLYIINGWASHLLRTMRAVEMTPFGLVTYGDKGWGEKEVDYHGFANHGEELTCIYNASTINVDVPRLYQRDIITMRVFDVMASGGLVMTESSPGIESLFESGTHMITYKDTADLREIIDYYAHHPEEAKAISDAGHHEVLEKHLIRYRVDEILKRLKP